MISVAPPATWLLVRMKAVLPSTSMMTPLPVPTCSREPLPPSSGGVLSSGFSGRLGTPGVLGKNRRSMSSGKGMPLGALTVL